MTLWASVKNNDTADNLLLKDRKKKNEIINSQRTKPHIPQKHTNQTLKPFFCGKSSFLADTPVDNCIFVVNI